MRKQYKRFTANKSFDDALNKALDQKIYLQGVEIMKHYFVENKTPKHSPLYECARTNLLMHFGSLNEVR